MRQKMLDTKNKPDLTWLLQDSFETYLTISLGKKLPF
jgi:hypothetical protein